MIGADGSSWGLVSQLFIALVIALSLGFIFNKIYLLSQGISGRLRENPEPREFIGTREEWISYNFELQVLEYDTTYCNFWLHSLKYDYVIKLKIDYEKEFITCSIKMSTSGFHDTPVKFNTPYDKTVIVSKVLNEISLLERKNSQHIKPKE